MDDTTFHDTAADPCTPSGVAGGIPVRKLCPCGKLLRRGRRKYCSARCGSLYWKRLHRRENRGKRTHLDWWLSRAVDEEAARAAYNAYHAEYQRRRRQLRRAARRKALLNSVTVSRPRPVRGKRS